MQTHGEARSQTPDYALRGRLCGDLHVTDPARDLAVAGLGLIVIANREFFGDRLDALHATRCFLSIELFGVALHMPGMHDDTIVDGGADGFVMNAGIPLQFVEHIKLQLVVGFQAYSSLLGVGKFRAGPISARQKWES